MISVRCYSIIMSNFASKWFENIENKDGVDLLVSIVKAVLLAWIPAHGIWFIVQQIYPGPSENENAVFLKTPLRAFTLLILLAPMLETYMMRFIFYVVGKISKTQTKINIIASISWGVMHWNSGSWGLHAVWAFFVMGICFLRLQKRSMQHALYVTMIIHAIFNALSYAIYLLLGVF